MVDTDSSSTPAPVDTPSTPTESEDETASDSAEDADAGAGETEAGAEPIPKARKSTTKTAATVSDNLRQVSTAEAEGYARESNLLFFEASAKTGQNVGELFTEIGESSFLCLRFEGLRGLKPFYGNRLSQDHRLTFSPAKTIPLDTIAPKPTPAGRRSGSATTAQPEGNVNLGDGQQAKKGGCC